MNSFWLLFGLKVCWKQQRPSSTVFQLLDTLEYDSIMCWPWFMLKTQEYFFQKKCCVYVRAFEAWLLRELTDSRVQAASSFRPLTREEEFVNIQWYSVK